MEIKELTREEAIRRHRLMWNWLADEAEKGKVVGKKLHLSILDGTRQMFLPCAGAVNGHISSRGVMKN